MPSRVAVAEPGSIRRFCLQRKGVQHRAHVGAEGGVDHLVLLDAGLAAESFGGHGRGVVVAVAGEVADFDDGVGKGRP